MHADTNNTLRSQHARLRLHRSQQHSEGAGAPVHRCSSSWRRTAWLLGEGSLCMRAAAASTCGTRRPSWHVNVITTMQMQGLQHAFRPLVGASAAAGSAAADLGGERPPPQLGLIAQHTCFTEGLLHTDLLCKVADGTPLAHV